MAAFSLKAPVMLGIGANLVDQAGVGVLALVEGLDDLDAVDVLDHRAAHFAGGLDSALIILGVWKKDTPNHTSWRNISKYRKN